jgi:thiol-disulfide isomerase/thioredoxin
MPTDIAIENREFTAEIDKDSAFTLIIPSKKDLFGTIHYGHFYHRIYLSPDDNLTINIIEDTIQYAGKGADRNMFLYEALERHGCNGYYGILRQSRDINDQVRISAEKHNRCVKLIEENILKYGLSDSFKNFILLNDQIEYEGFLIFAYRRHFGKNRGKKEGPIPPVFDKIATIKSFVDDSKLSIGQYLYNVRNFVYQKAAEINSKEKNSFKSAINTVMFDSLTGKTKVYAIANWLDIDFQHDKFDTLVYDRFRKEIKDSLAQNFVRKSLDKYLEKQRLIGKPLNKAFKSTLLEDDKGNSLTFGEMVERYKGKVIFLDIWSLGCGPCRANMPKSKALKEKLKNYPIEFVYITQDKVEKNSKLWEKIYDVSLTKDNHYRFVNSYNAKLLKDVNIRWVPDYMIINKNGNLISYNTMQPSNPGLEKELMKYLQ